MELRKSRRNLAWLLRSLRQEPYWTEFAASAGKIAALAKLSLPVTGVRGCSVEKKLHGLRRTERERPAMDSLWSQRSRQRERKTSRDAWRLLGSVSMKSTWHIYSNSPKLCLRVRLIEA